MGNSIGVEHTEVFDLKKQHLRIFHLGEGGGLEKRNVRANE